MSKKSPNKKDINPNLLAYLILILIAIICGGVVWGFYQYRVIPEYSQITNPQILSVKDTNKSNQKNIPIKDWENYINSKFDYSIKYPEDWFIYDKGWLKIDNTYLDPQKTVFFANTPYLKDFAENEEIKLFTFTISIHPKQDSATIENSLKESTVNREKIAGYDFIKAISTKSGSPDQVASTDYYINRKNYTYIISWPNLDDEGGHLPVYDQMIQSFKFEN